MSLLHITTQLGIALCGVTAVGQRFGMLVTAEKVGASPARWRCVCDCGTQRVVMSASLRSGRTKSCGCWSATPEGVASRAAARKTHGLTGSPTYRSWAHMKERCTAPACRQFKWYGGRGITVCARWMDSFEAFLEDMGPRPANRTLDRWPNPNGNYEPGNCRWATAIEQAATMRRARGRKS